MNERASIMKLRVLIATLKSGQYAGAMALPPLILSVYCKGTASGVLIWLWVGCLWYHCWRLWLDQHYFMALLDGIDSLEGASNDALGSALADLWQRPRLQHLSLIERQRGALRWFKRTLILAAGLWLVAAAILWWAHPAV